MSRVNTSPFTEAVRLSQEAKKASDAVTREYAPINGPRLQLSPELNAFTRSGMNITNREDRHDGNDCIFVDADAAKWLAQQLIIAFGIKRDEIYVPALNGEGD